MSLKCNHCKKSLHLEDYTGDITLDDTVITIYLYCLHCKVMNIIEYINPIVISHYVP